MTVLPTGLFMLFSNPQLNQVLNLTKCEYELQNTRAGFSGNFHTCFFITLLCEVYSSAINLKNRSFSFGISLENSSYIISR